MRPFEIYNAAAEFKGCTDLRPWLIVQQRTPELFACFPISGENYSGIGFQLQSDHPDFGATGLQKTCYILDEALFELPISAFKRRRGKLAGELLVLFKEYAGL